METQPKLIYSPKYDIKFMGIERLHPFDSCKYSKTWQKLVEEFGIEPINNITIEPKTIATEAEILTVHTDEYLKRLESSQYLAQALELPALAMIPNMLQKQFILTPMLLATKGTIIAGEEALENGIAINLSGGYHHASQDEGEGFCIYSDIAISIALLRQSQKVNKGDKIVIIDLDAHQGNGLERIFADDPDVFIYDMYNQDIYPQDFWARQYIDYDLPLDCGTGDEQYLTLLKEHLPLFLNTVGQVKLSFYNAGTDIYELDPLGGLQISEQGICERDNFVFESLTRSNIPWVMVLSGGYTRESYQLISNSLSQIFHAQL